MKHSYYQISALVLIVTFLFPAASFGLHNNGDRLREFKKEISAASEKLKRMEKTHDSGCIVNYELSPSPSVKALGKDIKERAAAIDHAVTTLFIRLGAVAHSKEGGSRYMYTLSEKIEAVKNAKKAIAIEKMGFRQSMEEYEKGASRVATNRKKDCAETPKRLKAPLENLDRAMNWIDVMEHDFGEIQAWLENMPEAENIPKFASLK